jgi:hypothetical protein
MSTNIKRTFILSLLFSLVACAPSYYRYTGPTNSSQQDFMNIRYQCLRETQQRVSGAFVNQYGGASSSTVMPTCSAFNACLASKGFYRSDTPDLNVFNQPGNFSVPQGAVINCSP